MSATACHFSFIFVCLFSISARVSSNVFLDFFSAFSAVSSILLSLHIVIYFCSSVSSDGKIPFEVQFFHCKVRALFCLGFLCSFRLALCREEAQTLFASADCIVIGLHLSDSQWIDVLPIALKSISSESWARGE